MGRERSRRKDTHGEHDDDEVLLLDIDLGDSLGIIEHLSCRCEAQRRASQLEEEAREVDEM